VIGAREGRREGGCEVWRGVMLLTEKWRRRIRRRKRRRRRLGS